MRRQACFCGVEVITHCVMANHFHVLVKVPSVAPEEVSDGELVRRFRALYPKPTACQPMTAEVLEGILKGGGDEASSARGELLERMHDVSVFMKELKQRFSIWYNHRHGRHGTLWSERFKSVLVEGSESALRVVSAYVDLNPVRAGLVEDPKDYAFSGYGSACGGDATARVCLARALGAGTDSGADVDRALASYRVTLYGKGSASAAGKRGRLDPASARRVMESGGELSASERLLCRMRALRDGIAFGCLEFVAEAGEIWRRGRGLKRRRRPAALEGTGEDGGLFALRK